MVSIGVIPVGGRGRRLRDVLKGTPKVLFKVYGREILVYPLLSLIASGCRTIYLITTGLVHNKIKSFIEEVFVEKYINKNYIDINVINVNAEGTAWALYSIKDYLDEPFIYTNGNIIFDPSYLLRLRIQFYAEKRVKGVLLVSDFIVAPTHPFISMKENVEDILIPGKLNSQDRLSTEENRYNSLETYILSPELIEYIKRVPKNAMTMEALKEAIKEGHLVKAIKYTGFWYHLAEPNDVKLLSKPIIKRKIIQYAKIIGLKLY